MGEDGQETYAFPSEDNGRLAAVKKDDGGLEGKGFTFSPLEREKKFFWCETLIHASRFGHTLRPNKYLREIYYKSIIHTNSNKLIRLQMLMFSRFLAVFTIKILSTYGTNKYFVL